MPKLKVNKEKDALVIVDVQNDFCPGGALAVPRGDEVVPVINSLAPKFKAVFTTRDWHPEKHVSFKAQGGIWPPHCVANTRGAEFHARLKVRNARLILKGTDPQKEAYSGFQGTDLAEQLRRDGIERVFVCGLATDYCVKSTAFNGIKSGFKVAVVEDAIRGVEVKPGDSATALEEMRKAGAEIIQSKDLS